MNIKLMQVGPIGTNCYILEHDNKIAVIDPGDEAGRILAELKKSDAQVEYILLTHGHYDHTTAVPQLHKALPQAGIYIHRADADGAGNTLFPLAGQVEGLLFYGSVILPFVDRFPTNLELYKIMTTKLSEVTEGKEE